MITLPFEQSHLMPTADVRAMSVDAQRVASAHERKLVVSSSSNTVADQGRNRIVIAECIDADHARFIAAACNVYAPKTGRDSMMEPYHARLREILRDGYRQDNRTTSAAWTLPYGAAMTYDLQRGFPAITTKRLHFAGILGEIIGFLRGYMHASDFTLLGCGWWHKDADENTQWLASPWRDGDGDLGRIYGAQWREWRGDHGSLDQVQAALDAIRNNPTSRRIIISAWRPDEFDQMALPPCHVLYKFSVNVEAGELNMSLYQRSSDMFLGVPMNIAGGALMLHLFAAATGLKPRWFTHYLDDTHIYENAIDAAAEQLCNDHLPPPRLVISRNLMGVDADGLAAVNPSEITLAEYHYHELRTPRVPMVTG